MRWPALRTLRMSNIKHRFVCNVDKHSHFSGFIRNYLVSRDQLEFKFLMLLLQDEIAEYFFLCVA